MANKTKYSKLFEPGLIGNLGIPNRIVKSSLATGMGNMDGTVNERIIRHYKEMALGGAGLVNVASTWIDNLGSKPGCQGMLGVADNQHIPGLMWLARTIQDNGAKAGIQLEHAGSQKMLGNPPVKAPSRVPWEEAKTMGFPVPEELTFEEIEEIVEAFGNAAQRAQWAGFDLVELQGAHGYLITNFLSPRTNLRNDWYGGSLENRMRFLLELVGNIRKKVGPDYPLSVRLSGTDYEPDGIKVEETINVAKALEKSGVNILHISGGDHHQMAYQISPMYVPLALHAHTAEKIKQAVNIPVISSGAITSPELAEEILSSGKADYVGLGRPLLSDPYFPKKARENRAEDIVPCIRCCDGCLDRGMMHFGHILCTVNVNCGGEGDYDIIPAKIVKKVAVVGGGPAGMEAARVVALKGHQVTLFEKRELGGRLIEASIPSFKSDLKPLINYYAYQMTKHKNIDVVKKEISPKDIKEGEFEAVVVAIGGKNLQADIPCSDKSKLLQWEDALHGTEVGENILVAGGALIGTELALYLAEGGKKVAIVEMLDTIASGIETATLGVVMSKIAEFGIAVHTGQRLEAITGEGVETVDRFGNKKTFDCNHVISALGFYPQRDFAAALREESIEVFEVGDALRPGKIFDAVHGGHVAVRYL